MKKTLLFFLAAFLFTLQTALPLMASPEPEQKRLYARAEIPTPVLNTPDFKSVFGGANGRTLKRDRQGLIRAVEFIAPPGTAFYIEGAKTINGLLIYRVQTRDYPPQQTGLYIDSRFVKVAEKPFPDRPRRLPAAEQILRNMAVNEGARYVWGGNISQGIPEMLKAYPPSADISPADQQMWTLKGLDCSGLLYEAANGMTPRNTSDLIYFGKAVPVEGLSPAQIAKKLLPLDLIVWRGHVIIVLDQQHTIESCTGCSPSGGVTIRKLVPVLQEIMRTRTPVNQYPQHSNGKPFVVRRWY